MQAKLEERFKEKYGISPTSMAYAPGRIEFIGNHTDYNDGTVLGASIDKGVWVALALNNTSDWTFSSEFNGFKEVKVNHDDYKKQDAENSWVNYPLGVLNSMKEYNLEAPKGFFYMAVSNLPSGAGLSSSAAIELASLLAYVQSTNQKIEKDILIKVCKHAENHFVGMPCGILDQGVCGFGEANKLVYIECRGPKISTVPLPENVNFWIFNTHTKHNLVESLYATRNKECMDAAKKLNVKALFDVKMEDIEKVRNLEEPLNKRALHVVGEIDRVAKVNEALKNNNIEEVGKLATASHRSSQTQFENSTQELDFLVDILARTENVFGARLTGGGFGGAVLAITNANFDLKQAESVADKYQEKFGKRPDIINTKTGPGAHTIDVKPNSKVEKKVGYDPKDVKESSSVAKKVLLGVFGVGLAYLAFKNLRKTSK